MGYPIQQSTTAQPLMFFMTDSADKVSGKTGLSPTVTISKNGGSFNAPAGAVSEVANGWYKVAGNATDSNTLGPLALHATGTGADPLDELFHVVAYNPQDSVRLGLTAMPNAAADAAGGLIISDAGGLDADAQRSDIAAILVDTGTTLQGELDGIQADTEDIQLRLPAALVSGRMSSDAVAISGSTTAADNVEANIANLDATVSSRLASASITLSSGKVTPIDVDGLTYAKAMEVLLAALLNVAEASGSTRIFKKRDGTTTTLTITYGATAGERTASTIA